MDKMPGLLPLSSLMLLQRSASQGPSHRRVQQR
jgi:hypothetical protein